MEVIKSVRSIQERKNKKGIAPVFQNKKIKLNFNLPHDNFFDKVVSYYMNLLIKKDDESNEEALNRIISSIGLNFINISYKKISLSDGMHSRVKGSILKYNYSKKTRPSSTSLNDIEIYKISMSDTHGTEYTFYTTLDVALNKKFRKYSFSGIYDYVNYYIMDIYRISAELMIIKSMEIYINLNKDIEYTIALKLKSMGIKKHWTEVAHYVNLYLSEMGMDNIQENKSLSSIECYEIKYLFDVYMGLPFATSLDDIYSIAKLEAINLNLSEYKSCNLTYLNNKYMMLSKTIFEEMFKDNEDIEYEYEYEKNITSDYARAFETKKNIPEKVQERMNNSKFLEYFSYVEYDSETDLEKIKKIEQEFLRVAEYLGLKSNNATIRFRKLGRHKALGLYVQGYNCVCIDLDGVSSTLHEIIHMLDYTLEARHIRDIPQFKPIARKYIYLLDKYIDSLPNEHPFKNMYLSKNKYNKKYFQNRSEIFARCGEIYLKRILGLQSNLLSDCSGPEYPQDEELENMIETFFSKYVFNHVKEKFRFNSDPMPIYPTDIDGQLMLVI